MSGENRTDIANGIVPWWRITPEEQLEILKNTESPPRVVSGMSVVTDNTFLTTSVGFNVVTDKDLRKARTKRKAQRAARKIQRRHK